MKKMNNFSSSKKRKIMHHFRMAMRRVLVLHNEHSSIDFQGTINVWAGLRGSIREWRMF